MDETNREGQDMSGKKIIRGLRAAINEARPRGASMEIEALQRAFDAAVEDGDAPHAAALLKAIIFAKRRQREKDAGIANPIAPWMP